MSGQKNELQGFLLCVGTYEGGLTVVSSTDFSPVAAFQAHLGVVKSAACLGNLLATCSVDESAKAFDLGKQVELATVFDHEESITACALLPHPKAPLLLTGDCAGKMIVRPSDDWDATATLVGHRESIVAIAAHPSGRVALSVSLDRTLRLWDIDQRVCARTHPFDSAPVDLAMSPEGEQYAVAFADHVDVYSIRSDTPRRFALPAPRAMVTAVAFGPGGLVAVGDSSGRVLVVDFEGEPVLLNTLNPGASRIKGVQFLGAPLRGMAVADSSGKLAVWRVACPKVPKKKSSSGCPKYWEWEDAGSADLDVRVTAFAAASM